MGMGCSRMRIRLAWWIQLFFLWVAIISFVEGKVFRFLVKGLCSVLWTDRIRFDENYTSLDSCYCERAAWNIISNRVLGEWSWNSFSAARQLSQGHANRNFRPDLDPCRPPRWTPTRLLMDASMSCIIYDLQEEIIDLGPLLDLLYKLEIYVISFPFFSVYSLPSPAVS